MCHGWFSQLAPTSEIADDAYDPTLLKISFEGVFQDGTPRAMPGDFVYLGGCLDPNATGADLALRLLALTKQLRGEKLTEGFFSMQAGNAVFVSAGPERLHERYGRIGGRDAGKIIPALNLNLQDLPSRTQFQAQDFEDVQFEGVVDVVGGAWENAVYRVELVIVTFYQHRNFNIKTSYFIANGSHIVAVI